MRLAVGARPSGDACIPTALQLLDFYCLLAKTFGVVCVSSLTSFAYDFFTPGMGEVLFL